MYKTVRPALEQQAVTMLFLQLNLWGSEERLFIFNHLKWCFTRYKALSAEFVFNLRKYVEIYNGVINLEHIFSF